MTWDIGYAPFLCTNNQFHIARRDPASDPIIWRCQNCGRAWDTKREEHP